MWISWLVARIDNQVLFAIYSGLCTKQAHTTTPEPPHRKKTPLQPKASVTFAYAVNAQDLVPNRSETRVHYKWITATWETGIADRFRRPGDPEFESVPSMIFGL